MLNLLIAERTDYCASETKCRAHKLDGRRMDVITADQPMTAEQAATLKRLAKAAYELDAFKPNLTRAEADRRIAALTAKLKLLGEPPHTL